MTASATVPLFPQLLHLWVLASALLLLGSALTTHRFRSRIDHEAFAKTLYLAVFSLAWVVSTVPGLLAASPALPVPITVSLREIAWSLAVIAGWLLCGAAWRRTARLAWRGALVACALGLLMPGALGSLVLPLLLAAGLLLLRGLLVKDAWRWRAIGTALLLLLAGLSILLAESWPLLLPQALVLSVLILRAWWEAGLPARQRALLLVGLLLFPGLIWLSAQVIERNEKAFGNDLLRQAYADLELAKSRVEVMSRYASGLMKVAASDPITLDAAAAPGASMDFRFRILNRRIGADLTFLLDIQGQVIATSRPALAGKNYSYRPYFQSAVRGQEGRYIARGAATGL